MDENDNVIHTSQHREKPLRDGDSGPNFIHAFNAYTPPGTVEGDLVYVHYARVEDLRKVKELGLDLKGKICMARYGKIFRGNKLKHCQEDGAIGMILFSDPGDVAVQGTEPENVYPNTIFLPGIYYIYVIISSIVSSGATSAVAPELFEGHIIVYKKFVFWFF